ncbi:MAG: hypothetical protein M3Z46_13000, partial [Actinomycetota bacterium]|nr:hypothetical protein [Actinomycetota bacterium]
MAPPASEENEMTGRVSCHEHFHEGVHSFLLSSDPSIRNERRTLIFIGHDWAEAHHDVEVQDEAG